MIFLFCRLRLYGSFFHIRVMFNFPTLYFIIEYRTFVSTVQRFNIDLSLLVTRLVIWDRVHYVEAVVSSFYGPGHYARNATRCSISLTSRHFFRIASLGEKKKKYAFQKKQGTAHFHSPKKKVTGANVQW